MLQTKSTIRPSSQITELPYYGFIAIVFVVCKLWYKQLGSEELLLLLTPISYLVGFFGDSTVQFSGENGYYLAALNIVIDKGCSGFNFWLISFVVLGFAVIMNIIEPKRKAILLILSLFVAYLLTIIANTSRILSIIKMNNLFPDLDKQYEWSHATQGTFVYLFFLISFYLITLKIIRN